MRINKLPWLLGLLILSVLLFGASTMARDYFFPQLDISVQINPDGSLEFTEQRTVKFEGEYSGLFQWIDTQGQMEIVDIVVSEDGVPYQFNPGNEPGPVGTYYVEDSGDQVYVDWSFAATDETRLFTLEYKVLNAILVHDDVAELYYQFIGDQWEKAVDDVRIVATLPDGTNEELRAWGHGPLHGLVSLTDNQVIWEVSPLPRRTMLEGRMTFSPQLVPLATNKTGEPGLPEILSQEQEWANRANQKRARQRVDGPIALVIGISALLLAIFFWHRYDREYRPEFTGEYYRELPGKYSPAELGMLWSMGQVRVKDLTATLLDLARRKHITLTEVEQEATGLFKRTPKIDYFVKQLTNEEDDLLLHEQSVLDFLFTQVDATNAGEISLQEITKYAQKHNKKFAEFWKQWQKLVKEQAAEHNFFDEKIKGGQVTEIISGIVLSLSGIPFFIFQMITSGIVAVLAGIILVVCGIVMSRRSPSGSTQFAKWKAFRRFLVHFSEISRQEIPALVIWEHYLVYAVTLGVAKKVIKQLQIVFPNLQDGSYQFGYGWYYYCATQSQWRIDQSLNNLTTSLNNSFQQSITSSTGGGGGGFSGGGGGGFGGGGGGAR